MADKLPEQQLLFKLLRWSDEIAGIVGKSSMEVRVDTYVEALDGTG